MTDTTFSDSYIETDAELETLIGSDPRAAAVALKALAAASQAWYCQKATQAIDRLPFQGWKAASGQALQFPRKFQLDPEQDNPWGAIVTLDSYGYYAQSAVPAEVLAACVEEAIALYAFLNDSDRVDRDAMKRDGVKQYNLGGVYSEGFGPVEDQGKLRSEEAYLLLEPWIEKAPLMV